MSVDLSEKEKNRIRCKANYEAHREERKSKAAAYYQNNHAECLARQAEYRATIPIEKLREYGRKFRENNREHYRQYFREYYAKNPGVFKKASQKWRASMSQEKRNEIKQRRQTVRFRLNHRISDGIRKSLSAVKGRKSGRKWENLVGYKLFDLKKRLESQFRKGMTWELFLRGRIHIDHIIPISKFSFDGPEDPNFRRCWALENLRPEWAQFNLSKGNKILVPSQIQLGL